MKKIITDCDGVLLDWAFAFDVWMGEQGYLRLPNTDQYFDQTKRYGIDPEEALDCVSRFNQSGSVGYIPAYKDSVEYVNKFAQEGYRFDVISSLHIDKFAQKLSNAVSKFVVGDGFNKSVTLGPLITEDAVLKVESHINDAVSKGAKLICGGKRHELGGNFFEPTLLTEVKKNMIVSTNETFGPVAPLYRFKDEDDVIKQANDTIFGLAAYFYAKDLSRVWRVSEALEYGMVGVNAGVISTELAPFGGVKQSGLGREGSKHGIEEFLEMKYICMSV